jgi:hypothetical protein
MKIIACGMGLLMLCYEYLCCFPSLVVFGLHGARFCAGVGLACDHLSMCVGSRHGTGGVCMGCVVQGAVTLSLLPAGAFMPPQASVAARIRLCGNGTCPSGLLCPHCSCSCLSYLLAGVNVSVWLGFADTVIGPSRLYNRVLCRGRDAPCCQGDAQDPTACWCGAAVGFALPWLVQGWLFFRAAYSCFGLHEELYV